MVKLLNASQPLASCPGPSMLMTNWLNFSQLSSAGSIGHTAPLTFTVAAASFNRRELAPWGASALPSVTTGGIGALSSEIDCSGNDSSEKPTNLVKLPLKSLTIRPGCAISGGGPKLKM